MVKLVATLSSYGRRAVVVGGVADRYAGELARAGQSNRRRAGTGSASSERATRPPLWPAGMTEGNRATFGPRVGLSSHGSPAKGGSKSKCLARVKIARTSAGPPSFGPGPLLPIVPLSPINIGSGPVPLSPIRPSRFPQFVPLSPIVLSRFPQYCPAFIGPVPLSPTLLSGPVPLSPIPAFPNRTPVYPDLSRFPPAFPLCVATVPLPNINRGRKLREFANRQCIANSGRSFLRHRITSLNVSRSRHVQRWLVAVPANTAGRERCGRMAPEGGDRAA